MQTPAKKQKLFKAGNDVVKAPKKNASASVTDVIVIEGPACIRPFLNLSSGGKV